MGRLVRRSVERWQTQGFGIWVLRDKARGTLLGHCGLVVNEPPAVELIYALARDAWGRGLATEAAACVAQHGFASLGLDRLYALVFPENRASMRVLEKLRFVRDGEAHRFAAHLLRYILRA
jgi:ribosomal-protein-alanine N-acetyltransferase